MDGHPGLLPLIGAGAGQNPAYRPAHRHTTYEQGLRVEVATLVRKKSASC